MGARVATRTWAAAAMADAEGREEGVQVACEAEGHGLAALQHAALVVDRVEVDLERLA